jgi:hypothetical protein
MAGDHGSGVTELIGLILADDLASLGPRQSRNKIAPRSIQH